MADAGLWAKKVPWLQECQFGSPLVEIDPALAPQERDRVLVKKYPSAFFGTQLHEDLQREAVDTIILAGCTTSVCVRATALDAMQHGYRTLVVREAVGDFDHAIHALHLADIGARLFATLSDWKKLCLTYGSARHDGRSARPGRVRSQPGGQY